MSFGELWQWRTNTWRRWKSNTIIVCILGMHLLWHARGTTCLPLGCRKMRDTSHAMLAKPQGI